MLLETNQSAQELLSFSKILKLGTLKFLYFVDRNAQRQFDSLKLQMGMISTGTNELVFSLQAGAIRYRVKLQPWMHTQIHALGSAKIPALMLSIRPMRGEIKPDAQDLMAIYRFTKAEADVAALLCRGIAVAEIAVMRNTSLMTVRQQLKTCMHKTLVHTQAELVAKLLSFAAG
jgi:DNA-binding CsgD family transcriptional regulator